MEISRESGIFPQDRICEAASESSADSEVADDDGNTNSREITVKVRIKQASGLPPSLSKLVFCQYSFWGVDDTIVVPSINACDATGTFKDNIIFHFDHTKTFVIPITEEFIEHCSGGLMHAHFRTLEGARLKSSNVWDDYSCRGRLVHRSVGSS